MNTLIVTYTPRQEGSKTQELVDTFTHSIQGKTDVQMLNLLQDRPEPFDEVTAMTYGMRNYMGIELDAEQTKSLAKFDRFATQFKNADVVVLAFPMYNFGMPGLVKTYMDMVMLKGESWDVTDGNFVGLMGGKKILTIFTSQGVYNDEIGNDNWNNIKHYMNIVHPFLGFDTSAIISAQNTGRANKDTSMQAAKQELEQLVGQWY